MFLSCLSHFYTFMQLLVYKGFLSSIVVCFCWLLSLLIGLIIFCIFVQIGMLKPDKAKDGKLKQKQDNLKSVQNLLYLIPPLETQTHKSFIASIKNLQTMEIQKLQSIYQTETDTHTNTKFLKTPFNSYKDPETGSLHYRPPHSNTYYPPINLNANEGASNQSNIFPSPLVRNIEEKGELLFEEYAKMYYGEDGVIANFFVQESLDQFLFAFCVQTRFKDEDSEGVWNSTNVANISGDPTKSITYKVTTSIIYQLSISSQSSTISGNIKRTKTEQKKLTTETDLDEVHLTSIGRLIEQNESYLRQQIESVYALKTKQIIHKIRIADSKEQMESKRKILKQLLEVNLGKRDGAVQF